MAHPGWKQKSSREYLCSSSLEIRVLINRSHSWYDLISITILKLQKINTLLGEIPGKCGTEDGNQKLRIQGGQKDEDFSFDTFPSWQVHFDYFSVDFDEEHSAFYGGVLNDQVKTFASAHHTVAFIHCSRKWLITFALSKVEFVSEAVSKILSLYKGKQGTPTR